MGRDEIRLKFIGKKYEVGERIVPLTEQEFELLLSAVFGIMAEKVKIKNEEENIPHS